MNPPPIDGTPRSLFAVVARGARLLRLQPFDTSTSDGRSDERHRRIALTAAASVANRCIVFATALISVPLTINYLGRERYGLWMIITSVSAMLSFADLGLGNGLLNAIAAASAHDDRKRISAAVSAAVQGLSAVALTILLILVAAYRWIPWPAIFNVHSLQARAEAGPALAIFIVCFALNLPLSIVQRVQLGLQQGFANNLCAIVGNLGGLLGVLVSIYFRAGLPTLVLAASGAPLVATVVNAAFLFGGTRWLRPEWSVFNASESWKLLRVGGAFSLMSLLGILGSSSNNILIAQLLGAAKVAEYSVAERLFLLSSQITAAILVPLWPAYGEAFSIGDFNWIHRTLRRTVVLAVGESVLTAVLLIILRGPIYSVWIGANSVPTLELLIAVGTATVIVNAAHPFGIFLFSINALRFSMITTAFVSVLGMGAKILAVHYTGVSGVAWGTAVSQLLINTLPIMFYVPAMLRRAELNNSGIVQTHV